MTPRKHVSWHAVHPHVWCCIALLACLPRGDSASNASHTKESPRNFVAILSISPSVISKRAFHGFFADFSRSPVETTELVLWAPQDNVDGCLPFQSLRVGGQPTAILAKRGNCTFVQKARHAQEAGAAGVVIVWDSDRLFPMSAVNTSNVSVDDPVAEAHGISIIALNVPKTYGDQLLSASDQSKSSLQRAVLTVGVYTPPLFDLSEVVLVMLATGLVVLGALVSTADLRSGSHFVPNQEDVVELSHGLAVGLCATGSAMLMLLFRFMRHLVVIVQITFCIGGFWCTTIFSTSLMHSLSPRLQKRLLVVPGIGDISVADPIGVVAAASLVAGWWTFRNSEIGWLFQDIIGGSVLCMMQGAMRLPNLRVAMFLLSLMFVYDIFWVFISPALFQKSVMVEVARGGGTGEAMPMLLRVPAILDPLGSERVLGFGDIVLPGLLVSALLRQDILTKRGLLNGYFTPCVIGYVVGLILTMVAVTVTGAGQPALLYLIPATLGTILVLGFKRGELPLLWHGAPNPEAQDKSD